MTHFSYCNILAVLTRYFICCVSEQDTLKERFALDTVADHYKRRSKRSVGESGCCRGSDDIVFVVCGKEEKRRAGSHRVSLNGVRASWGIMHFPSLVPGTPSITAGEETLCPHSDYH